MKAYTCSTCEGTFPKPGKRGPAPRNCPSCRFRAEIERRRSMTPDGECIVPGCVSLPFRKKMCSMHESRLRLTGEVGPPGPSTRHRKTLAERLIALSEDQGDCRVWTGAKNGDKGVINVRPGKQRRAHLVSYVTFVGELPTDRYIVPSCRNTFCIKPSHLEAVRPSDHFKRVWEERHDPSSDNP